MYNLFRFLVRYYLFICFLLLEVFCFFLIYQNNQYHQAAYVNMANSVNGRLYESYAGVTDYLYLRQYSDSLVAENARLHARLRESVSDETVLRGTIRDTLKGNVEQVFDYIPAKVIQNSVNQAANYIYINRGRRHGITTQMGVINPNGVVGQVVNVTEDYAAVMSLLNKNFKVSAKLKRTGHFGKLSWEGKDATKAKLDNIPKHVKVAVGDTVVTSGFSDLFPENILVGKVIFVKAEPENNFQEIDVSLSTNMSNLSYVYVVNNFRKNELHVLDSLVKKVN